MNPPKIDPGVVAAAHGADGRIDAWRLSPRKRAVLELTERYADERQHWMEKNAFFYEDELKYMRFLIPEGQRVLELGCGTGHLLAGLKPSYGVGIDLSPSTIDIARQNHPKLEFIIGDIETSELIESIDSTFDTIVLTGTIGTLEDCQETLRSLHALCDYKTRIVIGYYSSLWEPVMRLAEALRAKMPAPEQNWLSTEDIEALCELADFEVIKREWRQLVPKRIWGLGALINKSIATLPLVRRMCLRNYLVVRSRLEKPPPSASVSVIVPCRNEAGHVQKVVQRMPEFAKELEILFVEGNSKDDTWREINRVVEEYPERNIKALKQDGVGKYDAVCKGFDSASGEVLMILDGDLTVPPETLPKFYEAVVTGRGDFITGTRMVYPIEKMAMRFLNYWANVAFAAIFTWILNQRITDTLCGTKVLRKRDFERIAAGRDYFQGLDPFGDFDLIFGGAKLNLKILEIPIRYVAREYGETQISRFRHGWLLAKMVVFAFFRMKAL